MYDKPALDDALLEHFGIKGMRWGRRKKTPTFDTTHQTIKKGREIQTVTAGGAAKITDKRLFVSENTKDNLAYQSVYARNLQIMSNGQQIYSNKLTVKRDLRVASEKDAVDAFMTMYKKDPKGTIKAIAESQEALVRVQFLGGEKSQKILIVI